MTAQDRLLKYYKDAFEQLLRKISSAPGADWNRYYKRLLKEIEKAVAELDKAAAMELAEITQKAYSAAEAKALAAIQEAAGPFGGKLNRNVIQLIAENAVDEMVSANHYFGRRLADNIRQIGLDAIAEKTATAQTVRKAQKRIIQRLKADGMTSVTGDAGKQYRLDSYAELVARTTTREATNTGTTNTAEQLGYDLVKFSSHYPTCEVCAPIQDRVFSISGKDPRFPPLSSVPGFDKGFKTVHPHCRHVLVITIEALWTPEERARYLADAGKPVRGDTRTQQEVDRYNAMQAEKRDRRQDRRQYDKYRALLGDDAPKTFSAFRAIKQADDTKWKLMQRDYKRRARLAANPELVLPNVESSTAADAKFLKYFYNPENQDGYTKGLAFSSHLGYNVDNWEDFRADILRRSRLNPAAFSRDTEHGPKYEQKMIIYGLKGTPMELMTVWIIQDGEPRFVTAYPD